MSGEVETVSVRRTISGLWGSQPPAQLRPIYALRSGIRDDAAMASTHKEKCRQLAQASSMLIEHLVFKIYSDEEFRKSELGVPPYVCMCDVVTWNVIFNCVSKYVVTLKTDTSCSACLVFTCNAQFFCICYRPRALSRLPLYLDS
jgi:hypothetical protein